MLFTPTFALVLLSGASLSNAVAITPRDDGAPCPRILILGGGVSGIIAARTLTEQGLTNFVIIEGRDELGGRLRSTSFGSADKFEATLEFGANWVQGTQDEGGPANPIYELATKHNISTQQSDLESMTTYDSSGQVDFVDLVNKATGDYEELVVAGGGRVKRSQVDGTGRTGYSLSGAKPKTAHERAAEYYAFDWEYAQTPEQTSWIASSWANNYTFDSSVGGYSEENLLNIDQRGFKAMIQLEAAEFLQEDQIMLNSVVERVEYDESGVAVQLTDGNVVTGDYALCTFSLGVLQNDDVVFEPEFPEWKQEAIQTMTMGTYTKIFLQFPEKFWFDTEMALYADSERGRYPVWQSLDHEDFLPGSGIIFVTVTGDYSVRIEDLTDEQVREEVLGVMGNMFPDVEIPEPLDFAFYRWHSDPLFRGSYSNWPASFVTQHHENLRANVGRLFFAGEATSSRHFGFLHGAYLEGQDVALIMTRCVKEGLCNEMRHFELVVNDLPYEVPPPSY